ncbi:MAG: YhgE/Pip domain-containing protein [Coriobacteriaceae bacterium]|nr:YhgE/Pip domain-containing protein [Coriobacteriaceae bacterium]
MSNIVRIFKHDLSRVRRSVIGLIVAVGLVIIPCLYAWFNIAGSWDPYGNTGGIKVAVANEDEGYESDLIPVKVNMGDSVISSLRANTQMDWVFVGKDDAIEGVRSGAYYAAVVIPEDFSASMMTLFSPEVRRAQLTYYENQKANAIAPRVTDKGANAIASQVDEAFTETIGDVGLAATSGLIDFMDSDQVGNYVTHLSRTLDTGISSLRDVSAVTDSYASLLGTTADLVSSTGDLLSRTGTVSGAGRGMLADARAGLSDTSEGVKDAAASVKGAISEGTASFDDVSARIEDAFEAGTTHAGDTADQLNAIAARVDAEIAKNEDILATIQELFPDLSVLQTIEIRIIARQQALSDGLKEVAGDLSSGAADAGEALASARTLIADAKASVAGLDADMQGTLSDQADALAGTVSGIASSVEGISSSLDATVGSLSGAASSLAADLRGANKVLADAKGSLGATADELQRAKDKLAAAVQTGDLDQVRSIIGSDPEGLAQALAAPVGLETRAVYHIENYGSAMAPFYTAVSLWVGGIVLAAMMRAGVGDELVRELGAVRLHELYLGRFCLFGLLSLCQSTLMLAGELLFFGIQCESPWLYLLAGWVGGLMFCLFIYTLTVSFGDIGKALAVVLLVMQVGGSGGTFPIEMTSPFFQAIYPFLPAAHLINALHAAMAGGWGAEFWIELGTLSLYFVPILALGLVFRRPVIRANDWIIEKLEETKLM